MNRTKIAWTDFTSNPLLVEANRAFFREGRWTGLRDGQGGDPSEWPEDLRVREFPEVGR